MSILSNRDASVATKISVIYGKIFSFINRKISVAWWLAFYTLLIGIFVYLPVISLIVFSFNAGGLTFPYTGVTVEWYFAFLANENLTSAIYRSIQLGIATGIVTTAIAVVSVFGFRRKPRGYRTLFYLLLLGIITPGITYGLGSALFFNVTLGLPKSIWLALPIHVVWTLPFSFIFLLIGFDRNLSMHDKAARMMGADTWEVFRYIYYPQIWPGILGSFLFAFTLSYNESSRSLFVLGSENTIPLQLFSLVQSELTPELYALGTITTVVSIFLLGSAGAIVIYFTR